MRPHSRALLLPFFVAAALSLACAGVRVSTDFDPGIDFARYQSFAWLDPPLRETSQSETPTPGLDPLLHNSLVDQRVRSAVEQALVQRGYRKVDAPDAADFQLRYSVFSQDVTQDDPVYVSGGYGWGRYPYYGTGVVYGGTTTYQQGTLILDVIDPRTERIAWRGWAPSRTKDGYIDPQRLVTTVDAIVAKFPPTKGPVYPEE